MAYLAAIKEPERNAKTDQVSMKELARREIGCISERKELEHDKKTSGQYPVGARHNR